QVTSNGTAGGGEGVVETQQPNQPQQQAPNAWQIIKGVLFRIFIIWAISSWFRRGPTTQDPSTPGGAPRAPSRNLFPKDTLMDLHVFISEHEHFTDFNTTSALFWEQRDLVYGDWASGENSDGCYEHYTELEIPERAEDFGPVEVISHWHPNLTINIVDDHTPWDYYPINETVERLPFRLSYCPLSLWRWQLYAAQNSKSPWNFLGEDLYGQSDEEQDSVKVALLETNPYLLALTIAVSIVHSIFEFLAFKNDIQFWNSRQSLEGLSVRSVFFGVFQSLVVLLYILDNETNFVVQLDRENKIAGIFPRLTFKDKSTYIESSTKIYDDMAFRYLSWILFPLLGCYAVYSLLYMEHKGWYSWILSMLYGFLLTFALNTFIDDLFAFVIKMPMMYRIGCLRD
ncbi:Cleft lip and palate transmembrane protein 1-like protein, partial [Ophiophagus hannah]